VHAHADVKHQKPFKDDYRNVTWNGAATWNYREWVLLYGVLKKTTND